MSQRTHFLLALLFRSGIRRWLTVWGLGLVGTALGLTLAGSIYTRRQIEQSTATLQTEVASLTARHIQAYMARKIERLYDAAAGLSLYSIGEDEQKTLINLLLKNERSFQEISIIDARGSERLRISDRDVYFSADLRDFRNNPTYETAIQGQNYVSPVFTSERAEPYLLLAVPLKSIQRKIVGVVVAKTNMQFLWDLMREEKFGSAGFMYLLNEKGRLIAHRNPLFVLEHRDLMNMPKVVEFVSGRLTDPEPGKRGIGLNGDEVLSTFAVVAGMGWAVFVEEPIAFALADIKELEEFTNALFVAGLLVGALVIIFLSKRITGPILELRDGADIIEKGNLDHRVKIETNDEIGELGAKFNEMASALKNSHETLETRIELRTRELSALYDVTTTVNQTLDIEAVLNDIIKKVTARFNFDATQIFLFDSHFEILTLRANYNTAHAPGIGIGPFRKGQNIVGRVAESGEPALFEDAQTDSRYLACSESKEDAAGFHFLAALPIKTKTQIFGVAAFSSSESRELNEHDARLLKAICEHIAVAVERTRLFEEVTKRSEALQDANEVLKNEIIERKRAQHEVSRQHQRIRSLHQIGTSINRTLEQKLLLENLFVKVESLLSLSAVSVCLVDPITGGLVPSAQRSLEPELWAAEVGDPPDSPALRLSEIVREHDAPVVIENVQLDSRSNLFEPWKKNGWNGFVGLPLSVEGKFLGVLAFYLREPHEFLHDEVEFLATLAGQVAVAIFNSVLYENSRKQAIDLEKAIHAKDEFLNVMSHELRTPLSVIGGYAQAMSVGVVGEMSAEQQKIAEKIIVQSNELLRMINEILQVGSLQAGSVQAHFENTNLKDLFGNLQSTFDALPKRSIVLNWDFPDDMPSVKTDGDKLKHILQNLIHNAMKFTEHGSVTLSARHFDEYVEITVQDTGIGIAEDKLPVIFDMFRQVDSSKTRSYGGVGVGLFIVKKYVELLNGKIEVESVLGCGTSFRVRIPLADVALQAAPLAQEPVARLIA